MKKIIFILLMIIYHYATFSLAAENYKTTHRTMDNLRLRSESNTTSSVVTTLDKDTAVQVLETGKMQTIDGITAPWVKVLSESGFTGWCFSGYLAEDTIFSLDAERIDNPFDFKLGKDVTEIIANLGKPKVMNSFNENDTRYNTINKYTYLFYDNIQIILWYVRENEEPLMTVTIFSPSLTVFNGIHVGMDVNEVKKILGEPTDSSNTSVLYDGNIHYITFYIGGFNQIASITWTYYAW